MPLESLRYWNGRAEERRRKEYEKQSQLQAMHEADLQEKKESVEKLMKERKERLKSSKEHAARQKEIDKSIKQKQALMMRKHMAEVRAMNLRTLSKDEYNDQSVLESIVDEYSSLRDRQKEGRDRRSSDSFVQSLADLSQDVESERYGGGDSSFIITNMP